MIAHTWTKHSPKIPFYIFSSNNRAFRSQSVYLIRCERSVSGSVRRCHACGRGEAAKSACSGRLVHVILFKSRQSPLISFVRRFEGGLVDVPVILAERALVAC